jgi:hypothetical protein
MGRPRKTRRDWTQEGVQVGAYPSSGSMSGIEVYLAFPPSCECGLSDRQGIEGGMVGMTSHGWYCILHGRLGSSEAI